MGPEKNPLAYKLTESATARITEEQHAQELVAATLAELSGAMSQYPLESPVVEPTLTPKIYALGKVNIDPLGVAGPDPMRFVDIQRNSGVIIKAFAAPAHDRFTDRDSGYEIGTRVVLFQPSSSGRFDEQDEENQDLEFFGLNTYVMTVENSDESEEDLEVTDDEVARRQLLDAIDRAERPKLVVVEGKPVTGETNIFAIRHRKHGIVKFYTTSVKSEDVVAPTIFGDKVYRSGDHAVIVPILNGLVVEITQIPTADSAYLEVLNEFSSAITNLKAQRTLDNSRHLSPQEIAAIRRSLASGTRPSELLGQVTGRTNDEL